MTRAAEIKRSLPLLGAALAAAAGLAHLGLLLSIIARRIGYPLDLEWMEGGMLCHALRVMEGRPIYAEPSADFISFLYTPFYPFLLAVLGKVTGLSYLLGRLVSTLSLLVVMAILYRVVRRESGPDRWLGRLWGIAAVGVVASSFPPTGGWYDLVRGDTLYLALVVGMLYLIAYRTDRWSGLCVAGVLGGLAFLTKQTASLFIVLSGIGLLLIRWRRLPIHVAIVGLVAGGTTLLLNRLSDGWFWRYTFGMHQGHDLYWDRIWPVTEITLVKAFPVVFALLGIWVLVRPVLWLRARALPGEDRRSLFWLAVAVTGVAVSAIGFATQWASANAYIPGLVFPGAFACLAGADLTRRATGEGGARPLLGGAAGLLLGGALAAQLVLQLYSPAPHLPSERDRATGAKLIAFLRSIEGPVLMPYHPYYPVLAGKRPSYHQMGINDVTRAGYPFPPDVIQRVIKKSYRAILLDNPPQGRYDFVLGPYKLGRYFRGDEVPAIVSGYEVRPTYLLVPKEPEPEPPGARRIAGFESGTFEGWAAEGSAFGVGPIGGPLLGQGPIGPFEGSYLVSSFHGGDSTAGTLTSPEFVIDRPRLSFRIGGGKIPGGVVVRLLVGEREIAAETGPQSDLMQQRVVDVSSLRGQRARVQLVDRAGGPWGHLLFDDLQLRERAP
jgi:hypothetical protein